MNKNEKIDLLNEKLKSLKSFRDTLSEDNIEDFNNLKNEIQTLLDEDQIKRFNQIIFYELYQKQSNNPFLDEDDDLPF